MRHELKRIHSDGEPMDDHHSRGSVEGRGEAMLLALAVGPVSRASSAAG